MRRRALLGLIIGALALALVLWDVPLAEVGAALAGARLRYLIPITLLFYLQQSIRALRQSLLLHDASERGEPIGFRASLSVLCISFLFINSLPARLGEVVRPTLLWERHGVPIGRGAAMVIVERFLDLASAVAMVALVAVLVPTPSREIVVSGYHVDWVELGRVATMTVFPALLAGMAALLIAGRPVLRLLARFEPRMPAFTRRFMRLSMGFAGGFVSGLESISSPRRLLAVIALTALTWSLSGWMYVSAAYAFGLEHLIGYGEGVGLLSITMLGTAIPSAPGMAGTYEAFLRGGLALFGAGGAALAGTAVAYALTYHWWLYFSQAATALFFLTVDQVSPSALYHKAMASWRRAGAAEETR